MDIDHDECFQGGVTGTWFRDFLRICPNPSVHGADEQESLPEYGPASTSSLILELESAATSEESAATSEESAGFPARANRLNRAAEALSSFAAYRWPHSRHFGPRARHNRKSTP